MGKDSPKSVPSEDDASRDAAAAVEGTAGEEVVDAANNVDTDTAEAAAKKAKEDAEKAERERADKEADEELGSGDAEKSDGKDGEKKPEETKTEDSKDSEKKEEKGSWKESMGEMCKDWAIDLAKGADNKDPDFKEKIFNSFRLFGIQVLTLFTGKFWYTNITDQSVKDTLKEKFGIIPVEPDDGTHFTWGKPSEEQVASVEDQKTGDVLTDFLGSGDFGEFIKPENYDIENLTVEGFEAQITKLGTTHKLNEKANKILAAIKSLKPAVDTKKKLKEVLAENESEIRKVLIPVDGSQPPEATTEADNAGTTGTGAVESPGAGTEGATAAVGSAPTSGTTDTAPDAPPVVAPTAGVAPVTAPVTGTEPPKAA